MKVNKLPSPLFFSKNQAFWLRKWKLKTLRSSNYYRVGYFFDEILRSFPTYESLKRLLGIFLFLSGFVGKKIPVLYTLTETRFFKSLLITQDLNKIKRITDMVLQILLSRKCVQHLSKQTLSSKCISINHQGVHFH